MKRLSCLLLCLMLGASLLLARSHYATVHNQFSSLTGNIKQQVLGHAEWIIDNNLLVLDNANHHPLVVIDTTLVPSNGYQYLVRAAALHNEAGRRYATTDSQGNKKHVASTSWGIVFGYTDPQHYLRVSVSCNNSRLYDDITDKRQMQVEVWRHKLGSSSRLCSATISSGVDLEDGLNTLVVNVQGREAVISIGKKKLQTVTTVQLTEDELSVIKTGIFLSPGAKIAVERTVLTTESDPPRRIATTWTRESLDQHFSISTDPLEGYWQYQDRDMEDKWLRLGGRYTVAIVAANGGYDIIYINGAQVNGSQWQTGLLKGHISKTIFDGHYDLEWIDSTFAPITQDAYAAFENGVLMTLNFPVYKSQIRLSKVLNL